MCYDISFIDELNKIKEYIPDLNIKEKGDFDPDTMVHVQAQAFRSYPIITFEDDQYTLDRFEWGVIAPYMNTPEKIKKSRSLMCNAQSEKVLDKKSYWHRISQNRCLIPVTGIYEHRDIPGWKHKVPYHVSIKNRDMFCIPGLYTDSPRPDPETGEVKTTFTLLTREANELMSQIHNGGGDKFRMPLFLPKKLELQWLQPDLEPDEIQAILNFEIPSESLRYWPVFTIRTTKERPDHKMKNEPYTWPELPELEWEQKS
ncbi:MAG: SOS response-associated peptidase family protein [Williamsia sp.]|nr:SOS response-associated peptidase family protein [Williamsia sp.]